MAIISFGYRARVGKDTAADYLVQKYGFNKISFADALKRGCMEIFGLDYEQCYGETKEVIDEFWKVTPRFILQKVGTECLREIFDPEIWVKSVQKKVTSGGNWVIPDTRFINEACAVKRWGGVVLRIDRDVAGATGGIAKHSSEVEMESYDNWDAVIENNGTFDNLYQQVDELVREKFNVSL